MSARITSGTSWRGRRPGVRHWFSVSYYLHWWELGVGGFIWMCILTPFALAALGVWLGLETLVILASGLLIVLQLAQGLHLDWRHAHWQRMGLGLWSLLVPVGSEQ